MKLDRVSEPVRHVPKSASDLLFETLISTAPNEPPNISVDLPNHRKCCFQATAAVVLVGGIDAGK
jgi:hypothetical protein